MPISGIGNIAPIGQISPLISQTEKSPETGDFSQMLTNAIKEADNAYTVANDGTQQLLSGNVDNLAQIMIDGSKSELSLNLVIQVRNKILDAYSEVMRMQV